MNVKSVYIWVDYQRTLNSQATIDVDGIGEIKFDHALSNDLIERIRAESQAALQAKFKQSVVNKS